MSKTFRVLSAQISHETNTFSKRLTTLDHYRVRQLYRGTEIADIMGSSRMEVAAHLDAARRFGWNLHQPVAAFASPSGKTTEEAWQWMKSLVLNGCMEFKPEGIALALHGAMVTEHDDDPEGTLLRELRAIVGPDTPIVMTLDLHANVTDEMARHSNAIIAYRTYPHIDLYEVGEEAACLLQEMLEGDLRMSTVVARPAAIFGCNHGRTAEGPMVAMLERARTLQDQWAGKGETIRVSICAGFPWADIEQTGPSATVSGSLAPAELRRIAREFSDEIDRTRAELTVVPVSVDEAVQRACDTAGAPGGALLMSDFTDNPGHGGYGDGVRLLKALLEAGVQDVAFGCVADPLAVEACRKAGVGAEIELALGAREDPVLYGEPLRARAIVERLGDGRYVCAGPMMQGLPLQLGPTAVVRIQGARVLISSVNQQAFDREVFLSQGIDPADHDVLVVKSAHHFRGSFGHYAREILLVDAGQLVSHDVRVFPYRNVRRPVWPLD